MIWKIFHHSPIAGILLNLFNNNFAMKVMLDIKDSKAGFVMELLNNLSFVKATPVSPHKKKC